MFEGLLPELVSVTCLTCDGEGYSLQVDRAVASYDEEAHPCEVCGGSGELEVCGGCYEVPTFEGGLEVCGCVALPLKRAA